jgi:choline kinase
MSPIKHAIIAAAGLGSRLGLGKPKCLVSVAGKKILEHQLELLKDIPDVRLIVGYIEAEVIDSAFAIRKDLILVRNPAFRTTTTQHSFWLASRYLSEPCLYMDGDIIFDAASFSDFIRFAEASDGPCIAITEAKTEQAVFVSTTNRPGSKHKVTGFSRTRKSAWEWANLMYLPPEVMQENGGTVFSRLESYLPLSAKPIKCYEVDCDTDLAKAEEYAMSTKR